MIIVGLASSTANNSMGSGSVGPPIKTWTPTTVGKEKTLDIDIECESTASWGSYPQATLMIVSRAGMWNYHFRPNSNEVRFTSRSSSTRRTITWVGVSDPAEHQPHSASN